MLTCSEATLIVRISLSKDLLHKAFLGMIFTATSSCVSSRIALFTIPQPPLQEEVNFKCNFSFTFPLHSGGCNAEKILGNLGHVGRLQVRTLLAFVK